MKRRIFCAVVLTITSLPLLFSVRTEAQETEKSKVLLFTRSQGFEHGPAKLQDDGTTICGQGLKQYFADRNIELVETQDGGVFDQDLDQYEAFIFYTSGNLEDEGGSKNPAAKAMSAEGVRKMIAAVRAGKGFVGIHSATDTHCSQKAENGEDLYTAFVGARFSGHGPQQFASVVVTEPVEMPWLKETGKKITNFEEWYTNNHHAKDLHVVLFQDTKGMEGQPHQRPDYPSTWIRQEGKGRRYPVRAGAVRLLCGGGAL